MEPHETRTRQWQETLEVAAAQENATSTPADGAPQPGEIYLCRRTAEFPVEWLVLEGGDRLRCVPVDDYPLAGSRDVELTSLATGSAAVARCGVDAEAATQHFEPELRTRVLTDEEMGRVESKRRALASGSVTPSLLEDVADGDLDYQRWIDGTLRPAVAALEKKQTPRLVHLATRARQQWPVALAMAASLALVAGLGNHLARLSGQLGLAQEQIAALEEQAEDRSSRLAEQAERIETQVRIQKTLERESRESRSLLSRAEETLAGVQQQLSETTRELRQLRNVGAVVNVRKLVFGSRQRFDRGGTRGDEVTIGRGSGEPLLFEVEVVDPEPYLTYRLRFAPTKFGEELVIDGLDRDGASLRLSLPSDALEVGEYDILIEGKGFGDVHELNERYPLTVTP